MRVFTLRVEEGRNGLVCITSPEIKGLFVSEQTLADALMAASDLVPALKAEGEASGLASAKSLPVRGESGPA